MIPKAARPESQKANLDALGTQLDDEDRAAIAALRKTSASSGRPSRQSGTLSDEFIGARLGVGEIEVAPSVNPSWRNDVKLSSLRRPDLLAWPVSRPRPSRTIFRERPLLAAGSTDRRNTFRELVCWGLI